MAVFEDDVVLTRKLTASQATREVWKFLDQGAQTDVSLWQCVRPILYCIALCARLLRSAHLVERQAFEMGRICPISARGLGASS